MSKAFIIDPPLRNSAGHHRALAFGWAAAAHENGYDVTILGHEDWPGGSLDGFEVKPVFNDGYYQVATGRHLPLTTQLQLRQTAFRDTLTKPLRDIRPDDVLVLTFPTAFTMNGVAAWAGGLPKERRPRLIVWLLYGPSEDEFAAAIGTTDIVVAAYDRLRALFGERSTFVASNAGIADDCRRLGAGDFQVLPFIALRAPLSPRLDAVDTGAPLLGIVGHLQPSKGSGHMAAIIEALERQGVAARWLVAGSAEYTPPSDLAMLHKLAARGNGLLRLHLEANGLDDYDGVLRSLDLVVLPYSPEYYARRGSGVAEEAALLGVPIVAPRVFAAGRPGATAFDDWTPEAMSAAVSEAIRRLPELTEAARLAARELAQSIRRARIDMFPRLFPRPESEPVVTVPPTDELPQVDVVVTLHNYRRFIGQCLASVARQSYPNWRCIVVDDASTDLSFAEGRALVASFGPRFSYERHQTAQGQLRAVATGVSLGSSPFIALLDADDYLDEQALDHHVAWHLNRADPVAMTSGGLVVVDVAGTRVASALDNGAWRKRREGVELSGDTAFVRPGGLSGHGTATLFDTTDTAPGQWFWNPTSTMVFRRSVVELIMPEEADVGRYAGDTYLSFFAHELGGSLCFSATVAYYRRHGDNGYSGAPVVGIGTLPIRENYPTWPTVAPLFRSHLQARMSLFERNVSRQQIERLLGRLSGSRTAAHAFRHSHPAAEDSHGAFALSAMPYPELLAYGAGRLWRGGARRLLRRPVVPASTGADQVSFSDLVSHVVDRTGRGLARRFRR